MGTAEGLLDETLNRTTVRRTGRSKVQERLLTLPEASSPSLYCSPEKAPNMLVWLGSVFCWHVDTLSQRHNSAQPHSGPAPKVAAHRQYPEPQQQIEVMIFARSEVERLS
jgi:hypothetical protein